MIEKMFKNMVIKLDFFAVCYGENSRPFQIYIGFIYSQTLSTSIKYKYTSNVNFSE